MPDQLDLAFLESLVSTVENLPQDQRLVWNALIGETNGRECVIPSEKLIALVGTDHLEKAVAPLLTAAASAAVGDSYKAASLFSGVRATTAPGDPEREIIVFTVSSFVEEHLEELWKRTRRKSA